MKQEDYDETAHVLERGAGAQEVRVVKDAKRETRYGIMFDICICVIYMCVWYKQMPPYPPNQQHHRHHTKGTATCSGARTTTTAGAS